MAILPFRPDRAFIDVIREKPFTLSAEVIPPRNGSEHSQVLDQIQLLTQAGADFLAVTKGAGGSLRAGSLPIAQVIKETFGVPCIAHFTCRDLLPSDVENQLMDHHYFGIRNILALRGDPPDGQPEWKPREGGYAYAHQLIAQIAALNRGEYLERPGMARTGAAEPTSFCIGAAVYPEFPDLAKQLEYFRLKIEAGAQYAITDMLFDADIYARFLEAAHKAGLQVPILPGTRVLKSRSQAEKMMAKFRVKVPEKTLQALDEASKSPEDLDERRVELFLQLTERLKRAGAPGIHVFVISDTETAVQGLRQLRQPR